MTRTYRRDLRICVRGAMDTSLPRRSVSEVPPCSQLLRKLGNDGAI